AGSGGARTGAADDHRTGDLPGRRGHYFHPGFAGGRRIPVGNDGHPWSTMVPVPAVGLYHWPLAGIRPARYLAGPGPATAGDLLPAGRAVGSPELGSHSIMMRSS